MEEKRKEGFRFLPRVLIAGFLPLIRGMARFFIRLGIGPNALTVLGMCAGIGAGVLIWQGYPLWSLGAGFLAGIFDIVDGEAARLTGKTSDFGAFLDSTLDRYTEFFLYAGMAAWLGTPETYGLAGLAFLGSVMVSYTRARAEGLGLRCGEGWMQRRERLAILALAVVIGLAANRLRLAFIIALSLIAALSNFTAGQRILFVRRACGRKPVQK